MEQNVIKATILIQKWYRKHLSRMEVKRRCNWQIFQNIEYASEQDQAELYKFFLDLMQHMPNAVDSKVNSQASSSSLPENSNFVAETGDLVKNTFHLPIKKSDIDTLIDIFRRKRNNRLEPKYVALILREGARCLRQLPNLMPVSTAVSQQVTVCGDLHGKLDDLLVILYKNGLPSTTNPYIFNGDYVDRGKKSLEVLLLLLSLFLAFPNAVFLNRGNHEDAVMNARYGFIREMESKYPNNYRRLLQLIDEVYRWLPLGSIINNRVFIVHGGFSDNTNLDLLKSLDRGKYVSILRPPVECGESIDKTEWQQIFEVMWSDPQTTNGCVPNTLRGAGVYWGPDVTELFLEKNSFSYIIRSHECKPFGHEFAHNDKVITIFSASNYYAIGSNKGAYMRLNNQLIPYFVQFTSGASQTKQLSFKQRAGIVETSALKELAVRLREYRIELEQEFRNYDPENTGYLSVKNWCHSMEEVTKLGLPWRLLREKLAPTINGSHVNYMVTLDLLDTDVIMNAEADGTSVMDSLYENKASLETIFSVIDIDKSGEITLDEFNLAIDLLNRRLPGEYSKEEMLEKCRMMDINRDGKVDLNEFLEAFRLSQQSRKQAKESKRGTMKEIGGQRKNLEAVHWLNNEIIRSSAIQENDIDPSDCDAKEINITFKPAIGFSEHRIFVRPLQIILRIFDDSCLELSAKMLT